MRIQSAHQIINSIQIVDEIRIQLFSVCAFVEAFDSRRFKSLYEFVFQVADGNIKGIENGFRIIFFL